MKNDKILLKNIGKRLTKLREHQELTRTEMANLLGISRQQYRNYEIGYSCNINNIAKISKLLKVNIKDLISG